MTANDWPFVRGPAFDGRSDEIGIVEQWPDEGPPVLWVRELGQGYSAFVAAGDRVFTQGQNVTGQYVYCLNANTGETIWKYRYDWPYEAAGVYPGPRSTPTVADQKVYFTSPDGLLACLDADDGKLVWSIDLLETYGIEGCDFGYSCSATVVDEMVILPVGGKQAGVVAFDAQDGTVIWKSTGEPASYTPAYPIELQGEKLVVAYMQNCVLILNREDGAVRWKSDLSTGYDEHSAWPIYSEPYLWLSGPFRAGSYRLDLSGLTEPDGRAVESWRTKLMSNDVCSSVLADGHIYGFDIKDVQSKTHRPSRGIFRCMDFETGEPTWSVGTGKPRRVGSEAEYADDLLQSGIIVADGKLIVFNELGELILLRVNSERCEELARCTVLGGELTWTAPCLSNGRLFVRNQSRAVCVYLGDPDDLDGIPTKTVSDLPQRQYSNVAAFVLAVEPEYAFDVPHNRWLVLWYFVGAALLIGVHLLTRLVTRRLKCAHRQPEFELLLNLFAGAVGTTALGHLSGEFIFTWHVCLYAAMEYVAVKCFPKEPELREANAFRKRLPLVVLLVVCYAYYLACLRLSLVFEWAFAIGFPGAILVLWPVWRFGSSKLRGVTSRLLVSAIAYSCFYACAVVFLKSRY